MLRRVTRQHILLGLILLAAAAGLYSGWRVFWFLTDDAYIAGNIESDVFGPDGSYYFDKIILAGRDDAEPEGTVTVVRPDGTAETRRPDGTIAAGNPFGEERVTYSRRWVIVSSNEENPADRRLTIAVRVKSENSTTGKSPELVDLYTVISNQ